MEEKDFSFSLMFVPHKGSQVRTLKISHRNTLRLLWVGAIFVVIVMGLMSRFVYLNKQLAEQQDKLTHLDTLVEENHSQSLEIATLNSEAEQMQEKLDSLNLLAGKISSMLKIKSGEVSRGLGAQPGQIKFPELDKQVDQQSQTFKSYLVPAENYVDYLAHRPAILPRPGRISSDYGQRRNPTGRGYEFHDGIDIECNYADPVAATADGTIISAGWVAGWGQRVDIDHGYGMKTFYAHNSKLKVVVGQQVKKGDIIALAGQSGRSTGVHVHWGATLYGSSVNPLDFLSNNS